MKKKQLHLIILMALLACLGWTNQAQAQEPEGDRAVIYFDLAAGPITIKSNDAHNLYIYTGYVYQNNGASVYKVTGTHSNTNSFYVYQSTEENRATTGYSGAGGTGEVRVPTYEPMMSPDGTKTWREFIINNKDSKSVIDGWAGCAAAVGRTSTPNTIYFQAYDLGSADPKLVIDMTLDNVWCSSFADDNRYAINGYGSDPSNPKKVGLYSDGLYEAGNQKTTIKLKGDNHFHQVWFCNRHEGDYFHITSVEGDGSEVGSLTVTPINEQPFPDWTWPASGSVNSSCCGCAIATNQTYKVHYGLAFNGGTVYAATPLYYVKDADGFGYGCVGGGNNAEIHMQINGGILTSVCHGLGAAIGAGSGFGGVGGDGYITITGGKTYAYQYGAATSAKFTTDPVTYFDIPLLATAIGGGSTVRGKGGLGQVKITGGEVYAESVGGVAIGGGMSLGSGSGKGEVTIGSGATVVAKSVPGTIVEHYTGASYSVVAGMSIGGGKGGNETYRSATHDADHPEADGGDAEITITGGIVKTGSFGGGEAGVYASGDRKAGSTTATISGGTIQGQLIMEAGTTTSNSVTMTEGVVNNEELLSSNGFYKIQDDGGAIYMGDGTLNLKGGTITGCTATAKGGAVYFGNGTVNVGASGSTPLIIRGNTAGGVRNNFYLSDSKTITVTGDNFNPQDVGIYTESTANEVRVLSSSNATWISHLYSAISADTKNLFPDRTEYKVKPYVSGTDLYFTKASPWSATQQEATPAANLHLVGDVYEIYNVKDLTAFLWHVNGITTHGDFGSDQTAKGKLMADIDMDGHYWVPIGTNFTGEFDGNGYTIKNLDMSRSNPSDDRGLFGTVGSGVIKNVQLVDCYFSQGQDDSYVGGIISKMNGGTLSNSNVNGLLVSFNNTCTLGGLVGQQTGGNIHSSFATAELKGYLMGGLVGTMASGTTLKNSFANAKFTVSEGTPYVGGLVGVNAGTVENCYAREQAGGSHGSNFGYLAGSNDGGTLSYCYAPTTPYTATGVGGTQTRLSTFGATVTPYLYKHYDNQVAATSGSGTDFVPTGDNKQLLNTLNNWVNQDASHRATYTPWMRTCASPVNGDYPLLQLAGYDCVASRDNIVLEYGKVFNDKFSEYITANTGTIYLYSTPAVVGGTGTTAYNVSVSNYGKVTKLYIGEHVALKPSGSKAAGDIEATVGILLDNSAGAGGANPTWGGGDAIDWHMFSSPLQSVPLGINYTNNTQYAFCWGHPDSPSVMPYWRFYPEDNANHGYFPSYKYGETYSDTNTSPTDGGNYYYDWDFYAYYEPDAHWINFKRNGNSHWVEPEPHPHIDYKAYRGADANVNEANLVRGKGYLVSTVEPTFLQASGTLSKGDITLPLFCQGYYQTGYNLLGNPYQSYLDFNEFAAANSGSGKIWSDKTNACYYILDEDYRGYMKYAYNASSNEYIAQSYLHPHQGFMVIAENAATATFSEAMRNTTATSTSFRSGERLAYPLVNLIATEENGNRDVCTVELDRPDKGGAPVMRNLRVSKGLIYCRYDDADWAIAFTQPGISEVPVRFETIEDTEYTLTWDTENGDFSYLHLIDNLTGTDIDCLATEEYKFSSKTTDYASRFRLVFDYTGIEEPGEDGPSAGSGTFAFQMGDELVVNGEGTLAMYDVTGRQVMQAAAQGVQTTVAIPAVSAGVYVLRLTGKTNETQTQKIVIR